ncbi:hypothetical protein LOTGIDRAFT_228827 [Lottia gigantea]|uniref:Uncharacterized protein n=1 Tax=Lottia gigantea TaxID=225164 RepID=V4A3Z9_LOTGI|nr:hypothetical protein LOTGIDRAFT_228827 [Lottia gigantea]ESO91392.1 hypothetical protein LOTGIDRAFT_228827 [Lottia gigantea]
MVFEESLEYVKELFAKYIPDKVWELLPKSKITKALLVGVSAGFLAYMIFKKRYKLPPGPRGWPIVGNTILFSEGNLPKICTDLARKYGPVYMIYFGRERCVILNNLEVINEALLKKGAQTSDRFSGYAMDITLHNSEDIIFGSYGTGWKLRRKVAARALRLFMVRGRLNEKIQLAVSMTVEAMLKEKEPFDPKPYMFYTTLNIIAGFCFSASYEYDDPKYLEFLKLMNEQASVSSKGIMFENICSTFARLGIYKTESCRKFESLVGRILVLIGEHVEQHRANFKSGEVNDLIDSLLEAEREIASEGEENMAYFQPIHISLIVFDIFLAGNETSRSTLLWAMMFILGVPNVQKKIQEEVDSVSGGRFLTTDDRKHLAYTDAVLHEVMRLGPVAPLGVGHRVSCDVTLGGYDIPKGTMMLTNLWALHVDPDFWPDVDQFKPERFLNEDGKMAPKPDNWLPFSAGRRVCLGEPLAKAELHLILAGLFQQLEFAPAPGTSVDIEPDIKGVALVPKPFKVVVKKRY